MSDNPTEKDQANSILGELQGLLSQARTSTSELSSQQQIISVKLAELETQSSAIQTLIAAIDALKDDAKNKKDTIEKDVQGITEKVSEFSALKTQIENSINDLSNRQTALDSKIAEIENSFNQLKSDFANLKQTIDAELPVFRQRVESEQAALRQNIEGEQAAFRQAIETDQSALRQKLEELSTTFQTKHTEQQAERFKAFTDKITELQQLTNDRVAAEVKAAEVVMEVLEKYENQAQQVLGTVIRTSQAGVYKLDAIEEGKGKKFFRTWASALMLFAVAILVGPSIFEIFMKGVPNIKIDWHDWLERLPISAVLFLPAFYFARESTRHSTNERKSKRLEQILSTIDPYLELLDSKLRDPLKAKLAEQIFNPNESTPQESDDEVKNFISTFITAVKAALKKES